MNTLSVIIHQQTLTEKAFFVSYLKMIMKSLLLAVSLTLSLTSLAQFNSRRSMSREMIQKIDDLNAFNISQSSIAYGVARAPIYTIYQSSNYGPGYWQGLEFKKSSSDKFFESTYRYDMQGNLRETRSYFNIKRNGQLTKWSILIPTNRNSPAFVHTLR